MHCRWTISDYRVVRRLEFRANYDIDCSLLAHPVTRTTLMETVRQHYDQINRICHKGMIIVVNVFTIENAMTRVVPLLHKWLITLTSDIQLQRYKYIRIYIFIVSIVGDL